MRPSLSPSRRMSWMPLGTKLAPMGRYLETNSTRTSCIRMTAAGGLERGDPEPFRQSACGIGARVTVEGEGQVKGNQEGGVRGRKEEGKKEKKEKKHCVDSELGWGSGQESEESLLSEMKASNCMVYQ